MPIQSTSGRSVPDPNVLPSALVTPPTDVSDRGVVLTTRTVPKNIGLASALSDTVLLDQYSNDSKVEFVGESEFTFT